MTTIIFILPFIAVYAVLAIYAERKISAFIQDRLGPMEVGYYGIGQTVADLLKLLQKEDIVPAKAQKALFKIAPLVIFVSVFAGFSVVPLAPGWGGAGLSSGLFLLLAIVSLDVIGIILAGWSSNNKYSMLGTMRSAAQLISYEVPLGLSVVSVCLFAQSLDLQLISYQQGILASQPQYLFDIPALDIRVDQWGGFLAWNIFRMPLLFFAWGIFWLVSKSLFFVCVQMWIRWTYPRLRIDQLMALSWKYLTPIALILLVIFAFWKIIFI